MRKGQKWVPPADEDRCIYVKPSTGDRCTAWRKRESDFSDYCAGHQAFAGAPAVESANVGQRKEAVERARARALVRLEMGELKPVRGAVAVIELLEDRLAVQIALAQALDGIVAKLTADSELRYEGKTGEQLRGELQAWIQVNQMVTKLGADYLKIGLDERKVRIAEAQARILVAVIEAVLGRLDLTSEQRKIAAVAVPEEFERVAIEAGSST